MSAINFQMQQRNAANTAWDDLNPKTLGANVAIADSNEQFTATTVEGALSELFTNASSGKALIKTAITGKGGTLSDANGDGIYTHQELANGVNSIKQGGGNAVETDVVSGKIFTNADGVLRTGSATITSLGGKRFASGSVVVDSHYYANVTGLSFTPKIIILMLQSNPDCFTIVNQYSALFTGNLINLGGDGGEENKRAIGSTFNMEVISLTSNGFNLPIVKNYGNSVGSLVDWWAFD
ncbi:hypothetical protein KPL47_06930 [Clostridium estertheticum]|uniref:hypothetical protein n=1 Tax=Clostridium estertheticum TaxID=238834 RepID=UPI001C0D4909|nr:hypothetical protein [Clostridium estertheticum]MBU3176101.1 hypothetical protein [Clostridium estertheticum]